MNLLGNTKRRVLAGALLGGAILAGGGAAAYAASTSSTPTSPPPASTSSSSPSSSTAGPTKAHRSLLTRADHATLEIRKKGKWVTVTVDRGNVTAASATSITLARPDGQNVTLALTSSTKFRGKEAGSAAALKTGVRAQVTSMNGSAIAVTEGTKPLPSK